MSSRKQYMQNLQNKVNHMNNINPSTYDFSSAGHRSTYYNDNAYENNIGTGRTNQPYDYTSSSQRGSNQASNISSSNAFMRR
jgi:hypothetical protein